MSIKDLFHKIKTTFLRATEKSIPQVSAEKRYGNYGENDFSFLLKHFLPTCKIKNNIIIDSPNGKAEIDCLVLYQDKLFAIEIKRWKGVLLETTEGFSQYKLDQWTNEEHIKKHPSPFNQVNRAISLLKKQIPIKAWINGIVFFYENDTKNIKTHTDNVWFSDIHYLIEYIQKDGKSSFSNNSVKFFDKCTSADYIDGKGFGKSLHCIIDQSSLIFIQPNITITKDKINFIRIRHHLTYDELHITLKDGSTHLTTKENAKIQIKTNGIIKYFSLSKIDCIKIGE